MEIGIGLDGTLALSYDEQAQLSAEAARLGYTSVWTPEGAGEGAFLLLALRWAGRRGASDIGASGRRRAPARTLSSSARCAGRRRARSCPAASGRASASR